MAENKYSFFLCLKFVLKISYSSSDPVTHADKNVPPHESASNLSAPLNEPAQELKGIINAGFNFLVFNHLQ